MKQQSLVMSHCGVQCKNRRYSTVVISTLQWKEHEKSIVWVAIQAHSFKFHNS